MAEERLIFRVHAVRRMFQRGITLQEMHQVLETGEGVESYPHDEVCNLPAWRRDPRDGNCYSEPRNSNTCSEGCARACLREL